MRSRAIPLFLFPAVIFLLVQQGCNVTKNFPEGNFLLVNNSIKTDDKNIPKDELEGYIQQTPNSKLFGIFRSNIAFYNWGSKGKDTKFKKWLRTKVGREPVIVDTSLVTIGSKQMRLYLNNIGYFNSTVSDSIKYHKKKARVNYNIRTKKPYTIRSVKLNISDTSLARFVFTDTNHTLIHVNDRYNAYKLEEERTRITNALVNHGFYKFTANYIVFIVDSLLSNRTLDISIEILNPVIPSIENFGVVMEGKHRRYRIHNIYIYPQFDHVKTDTVLFDTVLKTYNVRKPVRKQNNYYFLYTRKPEIREKPVAQNILIQPGLYYNQKDVDKTYSQLSGLQSFKYINILFEDARFRPDEARRMVADQVDCKIRMARSSGQAVSYSAEGTNSAGALGVAGSLTYQNRNIFKGAQILSISLSASTQMQAGGGGSLFNTVELGANTSITFPQFLLPIKQERLPKEFKPKTILTLGYNYQQKKDPDYNRHIINVSFGYNWIQSPKLSHTLNPAEILMVNVLPSKEFTEELDSLEDERFKNQYTDHMIAGLKYTLTFSNQVVSKRKNFFYIRSNIETSGNFLYGFNKSFGGLQDTVGSYTLFGIPYSQFFRPDLDFRFYNQFIKSLSMVYRFYGGIGFAYGNSTVLPFEKAFIAGGANDMRGWRMGDLGPGTFHNDTVSENFGQLGDLQLQLNLEFRFPMYSFLKGALFMDIGNVWLLRDSPDLPGGTFEFSDFYKEFGIDIGLGLRLDLEFFILRLDPAIPIYMPSQPEGNRWYFSKLQFRDMMWNFGIGYPF
jgi:outer membrane protein assembly factor BamA